MQRYKHTRPESLVESKDLNFFADLYRKSHHTVSALLRDPDYDGYRVEIRELVDFLDTKPYVYAIWDKQLNENVYVGKGKWLRYADHIKAAIDPSGTYRNTSSIAHMMEPEPSRYEYLILHSGTEDTIHEYEARAIEKYSPTFNKLKGTFKREGNRYDHVVENELGRLLKARFKARSHVTGQTSSLSNSHYEILQALWIHAFSLGKVTVSISVRQLILETGFSTNSVSLYLEQLRKAGYFECVFSGKRGLPSRYRLNTNTIHNIARDIDDDDFCFKTVQEVRGFHEQSHLDGFRRGMRGPHSKDIIHFLSYNQEDEFRGREIANECGLSDYQLREALKLLLDAGLIRRTYGHSSQFIRGKFRIGEVTQNNLDHLARIRQTVKHFEGDKDRVRRQRIQYTAESMGIIINTSMRAYIDTNDAMNRLLCQIAPDLLYVSDSTSSVQTTRVPRANEPP